MIYFFFSLNDIFFLISKLYKKLSLRYRIHLTQLFDDNWFCCSQRRMRGYIFIIFLVIQSYFSDILMTWKETDINEEDIWLGFLKSILKKAFIIQNVSML